MVAPLNSGPGGLVPQSESSPAADRVVRQPRRPSAAAPIARAHLGSWLTAAAVAKAIGGETLVRGRAADGVTTDSRQDCSGRLFVALQGPNHDGHVHVADAIRRGARGVVVARPLAEIPGLQADQGAFVVRVADTGQAFLRLAAEHRRRHRAKVIGITGSCGKTTTKEWLFGVLDGAMPAVRSPGSYNNNIGVPLSLFSIQAQTRAAVIEIGTNAPGEIAELSAVARPDVAIVTCVAPAHLQGLGSLAGVAAEKGALPRSLEAGGLCILNGDDPNCRAMADTTPARVQMVSIDKVADWFATDVRTHAGGTSFLLHGEREVTLPRIGRHNVYNALFVLAAATELGVPLDEAIAALHGIGPAPRRLEPKTAGGVTLLDDTYNSNPESARVGLQALAAMPAARRRIAVLGEMLELGDQSVLLHFQLGAAAARAGLDRLVLVGADARPIADGALAAGMPRQAVAVVDDAEAARELLLPDLAAGDVVLLKASRGIRLDRLADGLLAALAGDGADRPQTPPC